MVIPMVKYMGSYNFGYIIGINVGFGRFAMAPRHQFIGEDSQSPPVNRKCMPRGCLRDAQ